jgi:Outer membrane protein beta-barrel domain
MVLVPQIGELSNDRTGWTAGARAEWMFAPHWSVFAEYNFMGFGTRSAAFTACGGSCVPSAKANIQDVLVGLNYKFQRQKVSRPQRLRRCSAQLPNVSGPLYG